jgi:hypothetical protein
MVEMDSLSQVILERRSSFSILFLSSRFIQCEINITMSRFHQIFTFAVAAPDQLPLTEQTMYDLRNTIRKETEMIDFTDLDEDYNEYEETESDVTVDISPSTSMLINSTAVNRTESLSRSCACSSFRVPMYIYSIVGLLIQTKREQ